MALSREGIVLETLHSRVSSRSLCRRRRVEWTPRCGCSCEGTLLDFVCSSCGTLCAARSVELCRRIESPHRLELAEVNLQCKVA